MSTQIFKKNIPISILFDLFDKICVKNNNNYIVDNISFNKGIYNNYIEQFLKQCIPYYHTSKQKYLHKCNKYNKFTTVVRQICNFNKIKYTSNIKYYKSKYEIVYFIFFNL
jgi:hypothetical protein